MLVGGTFGQYWAGLFCLLGHMFPCMFRFKGGKGILSGGAKPPLPSTVMRISKDLPIRHAVFKSAAKGIERDTALRMTEILEQETGRRAAALSGPSHAEEVGRGAPTGCVAAARDSS